MTTTEFGKRNSPPRITSPTRRKHRHNLRGKPNNQPTNHWKRKTQPTHLNEYQDGYQTHDGWTNTKRTSKPLKEKTRKHENIPWLKRETQEANRQQKTTVKAEYNIKLEERRPHLRVKRVDPQTLPEPTRNNCECKCAKSLKIKKNSARNDWSIGEARFLAPRRMPAESIAKLWPSGEEYCLRSLGFAKTVSTNHLESWNLDKINKNIEISRKYQNRSMD